MLNIFKQNHPRGLYLLFCVEMWERFSFYGMRALIVLYMIQTLLYSVEKAGKIYGLYTGFVYLTPLVGGYLADRYFGQRKCITAGAIFMVLGLFVLSFAPHSLFLLALTLMVISNGLFKSNISSVLGLLYGDNNSGKDSAFTIFYMGINLGAFLSPLVCGTIAVKFGFEYGFATAGIGMLLGLTAYKLLENKLLGQTGLYPARAAGIDKNDNSEPVTETQKSQLLFLIVLMLFAIPFWICFEQAGTSLTLFAEYATNRSFIGKEIPTGYFQSLNPLFIIVLAPLISALWGHLRSKSIEPTSIQKFVIALGLISFSFVLMAIAAKFAAGGIVSPLWLVGGYFIMTVAELCLSPIGLSLVSKLAPKQFLSLTMGCWFLTSFFGNMLAGFFGGQYENMSHVKLFGMLALISAAAAIFLFLFMKKFAQKFPEQN